MKIAVPKETAAGERRVALVPDVVHACVMMASCGAPLGRDVSSCIYGYMNWSGRTGGDMMKSLSAPGTLYP